MTTDHRPYGRAARLETLDRIDLASHAADLLRSKEEALQRERIRFEARASRAEEAWLDRWNDATRWLARARVLGASAELSSIVCTHPATVSTQWTSSMGVTYPSTVECRSGVVSDLTATAALPPTVAAYQAALAAAADQALMVSALAQLDVELARTRQRRRAIEEHLLPELTASIHELDNQLDEQDREEAVRIRLAVGQRRQAP